MLREKKFRSSDGLQHELVTKLEEKESSEARACLGLCPVEAIRIIITRVCVHFPSSSLPFISRSEAALCGSEKSASRLRESYVRHFFCVFGRCWCERFALFGRNYCKSPNLPFRRHFVTGESLQVSHILDDCTSRR